MAKKQQDGKSETRGRKRHERWPSLCQAMRAAELDDAALGVIIERHPRTVQTWRLGEYHPSPTNLRAISAALGVPVAVLLADAPLLQGQGGEGETEEAAPMPISTGTPAPITDGPDGQLTMF